MSQHGPNPNVTFCIEKKLLIYFPEGIWEPFIQCMGLGSLLTLLWCLFIWLDVLGSAEMYFIRLENFVGKQCIISVSGLSQRHKVL